VPQLCPGPTVPQRGATSAVFLSCYMKGLSGGRTRARTWDPMIKSRLQAVLIQCVFRHVLVSGSTDITMEFSFVGIQDAVKEFKRNGGLTGHFWGSEMSFAPTVRNRHHRVGIKIGIADRRSQNNHRPTSAERRRAVRRPLKPAARAGNRRHAREPRCRFGFRVRPGRAMGVPSKLPRSPSRLVFGHVEVSRLRLRLRG
jgi:hypothetical protein